MGIKRGFVLREVAGAFIVVPVGERIVSFNGMITLNGGGAFLWKQLDSDRDMTDGELVNALTGEYDIDMQTAKEDIDEFLGTLKASGITD